VGNIGDTITSGSIPAVGTGGTTYANNLNLFLTEVKTRLEAKVPRASLADGNLDVNGYPVQNASYLGLNTQGSTPSTPIGSLQRYNGNLYWINTSGAVQITSGTSLNTTLVGGITGDYGGANPAQFRFVDADQEYYAYDDFAGGAWARIWAKNFDLAAGATSANRVRMTYGGAGSYTLTLPPAVPGATAFLQMDTSGNVTATVPVAHTTNISAAIALAPSPNANKTSGNACDFGNTTLPITYPLSVDVGRTISTFSLKISKASDATNTITATIGKSDGISTYTTLTGMTASNSANAPGTVTLVPSSPTPYLVASGDQLAIIVTQSDSTPSGVDSTGLATFTWT
jgi:hypothetical protein